jgi:hypothetical protein
MSSPYGLPGSRPIMVMMTGLRFGSSEFAITAVMRFSYAAARGAKYPPILFPARANLLGSTSSRDKT